MHYQSGEAILSINGYSDLSESEATSYQSEHMPENNPNNHFAQSLAKSTSSVPSEKLDQGLYHEVMIDLSEPQEQAQSVEGIMIATKSDEDATAVAGQQPRYHKSKQPFSVSTYLRAPWLDNARGFFVLWLILASLLPPTWLSSTPLLNFFSYSSTAPESAFQAPWITAYDIIQPAFIWLMGLTMPYALKRCMSTSAPTATKDFYFTGFLTLTIIGFFIANITRKVQYYVLMTSDSGSFTLLWNEITNLSITGLLCWAMVLLFDKYVRLVFAVAILGCHQVILFYTPYKDLVRGTVSDNQSVLGFATFYLPLALVASSLSDLVVYTVRCDAPGKVRLPFCTQKDVLIKRGIYLLIGVISGLAGVLPAIFLPQYMAASVKEYSLTYFLISMSMSIFITLTFALLSDYCMDYINFRYLEFLGKGSLVIYSLLRIAGMIVLDYRAGYHFLQETYNTWTVLIHLAAIAALNIIAGIIYLVTMRRKSRYDGGYIRKHTVVFILWIAMALPVITFLKLAGILNPNK